MYTLKIYNEDKQVVVLNLKKSEFKEMFKFMEIFIEQGYRVEVETKQQIVAESSNANNKYSLDVDLLDEDLAEVNLP
jgi:hypothetical protein